MFTTANGAAIKRATVFAAAMGYVEIQINSQKAGGNAVLEPGWTQYDQRLLYVSYDVTTLLDDNTTSASTTGRRQQQREQQQQQQLHVELGNGWPVTTLLCPLLALYRQTVLEDHDEVNRLPSEAHAALHQRPWKVGGGARRLIGDLAQDDIYANVRLIMTSSLQAWAFETYACSQTPAQDRI